MRAQIIAGGLSYKNLIPVSGYFLPGTSKLSHAIMEKHNPKYLVRGAGGGGMPPQGCGGWPQRLS